MHQAYAHFPIDVDPQEQVGRWKWEFFRKNFIWTTMEIMEVRKEEFGARMKHCVA